MSAFFYYDCIYLLVKLVCASVCVYWSKCPACKRRVKLKTSINKRRGFQSFWCGPMNRSRCYLYDRIFLHTNLLSDQLFQERVELLA